MSPPCITQQTPDPRGRLRDISAVGTPMWRRRIAGGGLWCVLHGASGEKRRRAPAPHAFGLTWPPYSCSP